MPASTAAKNIDVSRDKRFWLLAFTMVLVQLLAFWMLCSYQVHRAQVREATLQVERNALADCLRSIQGATRSSCAAGVATADGAAATVAQGAMAARTSSAVPVNYVYAPR